MNADDYVSFCETIVLLFASNFQITILMNHLENIWMTAFFSIKKANSFQEAKKNFKSATKRKIVI